MVLASGTSVASIHPSNSLSIHHSDRCLLPKSFPLPGKGFEGGRNEASLGGPWSPLRYGEPVEELVEDQIWAGVRECVMSGNRTTHVRVGWDL